MRGGVLDNNREGHDLGERKREGSLTMPSLHRKRKTELEAPPRTIKGHSKKVSTKFGRVTYIVKKSLVTTPIIQDIRGEWETYTSAAHPCVIM